MSDLTTFRDHARAMADAQHKPECVGEPVCIYAAIKPKSTHCAWFCADHCSQHTRPSPDPRCPGCVTDADRELWTRLADEADAWLARDDEEGLFG